MKNIQIHGPFFDKLSMTIDIPHYLQKEVIERTRDTGPKINTGGIYRYTKWETLNHMGIAHLSADNSRDSWIRIDVEPFDPAKRFMRIELNPSKIEMAMLPGLLDTFLPSAIMPEQALREGRITRVDIAIDLVGGGVDQFYFHSLRKLFSQNLIKSGHTLYLGNQGSERTFRIYDKAHHIKVANQKKVKQLHSDVPKKEITRVELELKPKSPLSLEKLPYEPNPFLDLEIYHVPQDFGSTLWVADTFRIARYEGITAAIGRLEPCKKRKIRKLLRDKHAVEWWNPKAVWAQTPNAVDAIIIPTSCK